MSRLDTKDKHKLLKTMLTSRLGDLREQSLIRQGRGWFHVSGMGHEALSVVGYLLQDGDYLSGYYRDRPIALARGITNYELALSFFAKAASASGGRQMPAHYSSRRHGIFSIASVVAASLLPACGLAWGIKLDQRSKVVVTSVGDAGTRQGDFFEALCFAQEKHLPLLVLVEDNGIGISTVTTHSNPLALNVLASENWQTIDGCDVDNVFDVIKPALEDIRQGLGPRFIWCRTERISSHSSADDHRKYRSQEELEGLKDKDPITRLKRDLIACGEFTEASYQAYYQELEEQVRLDYERAYNETDPEPGDLLKHVFGPGSNPPHFPAADAPEERARMVDTINATFHRALETSREFVFFGQDIEDPKGGVFSLTKGLSDRFPQNVFNSPLAESSIVGIAVGLAAYGKRPVFEIQFTDYLWAGFNHLVTHFSTLHWRTNGEWTAPAVIYAPYGAYLPGGALWHSQSNEAAIAHFPGLQIAIPSTPEDAAGLFWTAIHGHSPTLVLIPKHLMWEPRQLELPLTPVPFGKARVRREGSDLTIVGWGNCMEVIDKALSGLHEIDAEVIDMRTIVPLDLRTVQSSVEKTGRLIVVHEDAESCSVGQNIISRIVSNPALFSRLQAHPVLLAKPDVHIGYHPNIEGAALPSPEDLRRAARDLMSRQPLRTPSAVMSVPLQDEQPNPALEKMKESFTDSAPAEERLAEIRVPILGEGIATARVVQLIAQPGDPIKPDTPLCELETDKALFPMESSGSGIFHAWLVSEGDEVELNQVIAHLESENGAPPPPAAPQSATEQALPTPEVQRITAGGLSPHITARLKDVVPAHMTIKAGWSSIRSYRSRLKQANQAAIPSPTAIIAWAIITAMKKHPVFTHTVTTENTLQHHDRFDFGVAVALDNDALETAVISQASTLTWESHCEAYLRAVEQVRSGQVRSKASVPLILTSMGQFSVRDASPVVVPPAIATLFVGEAHLDQRNPSSGNGRPNEVVSLCLSFDHRWMNGVAAAQFLSEVRSQIESFDP